MNEHLPAANVTDEKYSDIYVVTEACKWLNGIIIAMGLVTNSLILLVLSRRRIGAPSTSVVVTFLAVTDLAVMVIELFVHYIDYYWKWFNVFHSGLACGVAYMFQATAITTSAWFLVIMTMERAIVVCFPIKAKAICTERKIFTICIATPVVFFATYSYLTQHFTVIEDSSGQTSCTVKASDSSNFSLTTTVLWNTLYFFVPAVIIVLLNVSIVYQLHFAAKLGYTAPLRQQGDRSRGDVNRARKMKKATTLVILASITFVVLMIPRGVSVCLSLRDDYKYPSSGHAILDSITYNLQYLNHTANFFVYFIANAAFRRVLKRCFFLPQMSMKESTSLITTSTAINASD